MLNGFVLYVRIMALQRCDMFGRVGGNVMMLKNLKKCLAATIASGMIFATISSGTVSANDKEKKDYLAQHNVSNEYHNLFLIYALDQMVLQLEYLAQHNVSIMKYAATVHNTGLNFNQIKDILDNDDSIDFEYVYKLSTFMGNYWVAHKHKDISQGEVFKKLLNVAKALHIKYDKLEDIDGLMSANLISLRDLHVFVNKGFTAEQKESLSVSELAKRLFMCAKETYTDFFRDDFQSEGYSGYGVCANMMERTGWNFDRIESVLKDNSSQGNNLSLHELKCIVDIATDGGYKIDDVINIFKNSSMKFIDVRWLYDKIVKQHGFACYDFLDVIEQFKDYKYADYVKMAEDAKKSGRTYFHEVEYNYFNVKK